MITSFQINNSINAKTQKEMPYGLGNTLFMIAGVIGLATKNGYDYGFPTWVNQEHFVNPLPRLDHSAFKPFGVPANYKGFDIGFQEFKVPDNSIINGYLGSEKYFEHCKVLIRHYFEMKPLSKPLANCVLIHYRNYNNPTFVELQQDYYEKALSHFSEKRVVVITDNVLAAKKAIGLDCEYINNSPIMDFYLLSKAENLIISPSTFSWWAAWLSGAVTVAPSGWFAGEFADCPFNKDWHLKNWIVI